MLPDLDKNDTIGILSLAYAYFRNLYLYKGYRGNKNNLAKETGLLGVNKNRAKRNYV